MNIPKAKDLEFKKLEDPKTPEMTCGTCGKRASAFNWYCSEIHLGEDSLLIPCCSQECVNYFKASAHADEYIAGLICQIQSLW